MASQYILDPDGNPVPCEDLIAWARWFEEPGNRRLARTELSDGSHVSTIFLGIDHSFGFEPGPVLWETMVFWKGWRKAEDDKQRRYRTRDEALAGHASVVAECEAEIAAARGDLH